MTTKICKTCNYGQTVYRKYILYGRERLRYCTLCGRMTENDENCDGWTKRVRGYDLSLQRFDNAEGDIKYLMQYFGEE